MTGEPNRRDELRRSFDQVADAYADARPGYPDAVFDEIAQLVPTPARVLEIGPGPGVATIELARRGYEVLAIELGAQMARVAKQRLAPYPRVAIVNADFHAWEPQPASFDLVCAASAFQWIDPAVAYPKAHAALRRGGHLALVWNHPVRGRGAAARFWDANEELYRREAPSIAVPSTARRPSAQDPRTELRASRLFGPATRRSWRWRRSFDADAFLALIGTFSDHITLAAGERAALEAGMRELIDERFGGSVVREFLTILYTAQAR